jgi:hypothetical protein
VLETFKNPQKLGGRRKKEEKRASYYYYAQDFF